MTKPIKTLYKALDFNSEIEYYDYLINSHQNGNFSQCRKLFTDMQVKDRKSFLVYLSGCYDNHEQNETYKYYFNLL